MVCIKSFLASSLTPPLTPPCYFQTSVKRKLEFLSPTSPIEKSKTNRVTWAEDVVGVSQELLKYQDSCDKHSETQECGLQLGRVVLFHLIESLRMILKLVNMLLWI